MMPGHSTCCVVKCKNTGTNSSCKFYSFPTAQWKLEQRRKWIAAVKRKNADGSPWSPKRHTTICSDHFVGGKKSDVEASPSYVPTIFPSVYRRKKTNHSQVAARYNRFMARRYPDQSLSNELITEYEPIIIKVETIDEIPVKADKECQADIYKEFESRETTFNCNRYIQNDHCDAEIQVEIPKTISKIITTNTPKTTDKGCSTDVVKYNDQSTSTNCQYFNGILTIEDDQQLTDIAGVTMNTFEFLLNKLSPEKSLVTKKNRLLIFLMKLKTGLTFGALGLIFGLHRTSVSRIFYHTLQELVLATADLVFWPDKPIAQAAMPICFRQAYSNTRVIIECLEFTIDVPSAVDRVACYSHNNKGFTVKIVLGIVPGGFICFKSKVAGGNKTDSEVIIESGIIDNLENGDLVLADKNYPEIKEIIDASGMGINVVMPPFLIKKKSKENQPANDISPVRINVDKSIQRLRVYHVLDKIHYSLYDCIDDMVHVCCVLVNLQTSMFGKIYNSP